MSKAFGILSKIYEDRETELHSQLDDLEIKQEILRKQISRSRTPLAVDNKKKINLGKRIDKIHDELLSIQKLKQMN